MCLEVCDDIGVISIYTYTQMKFAWNFLGCFDLEIVMEGGDTSGSLCSSRSAPSLAPEAAAFVLCHQDLVSLLFRIPSHNPCWSFRF